MTITLQTANPAVCTSVDKALCCSRNAITSNIGSFCDKLGCSLAQCGRGREPLQVPLRHLRREGVEQIQMNRRAGKAEKSKSSKVAFYAAKSSKSSQLPIKVTSQTTRVKCPFYGQLKEREFTEVAQEETSFQPAATNAVLNVTNTGKKKISNLHLYYLVELLKRDQANSNIWYITLFSNNIFRVCCCLFCQSL